MQQQAHKRPQLIRYTPALVAPPSLLAPLARPAMPAMLALGRRAAVGAEIGTDGGADTDMDEAAGNACLFSCECASPCIGMVGKSVCGVSGGRVAWDAW